MFDILYDINILKVNITKYGKIILVETNKMIKINKINQTNK